MHVDHLAVAKTAKKVFAAAKCQQGTNTYLVSYLAIWHLAGPFGQNGQKKDHIPHISRDNIVNT